MVHTKYQPSCVWFGEDIGITVTIVVKQGALNEPQSRVVQSRPLPRKQKMSSVNDFWLVSPYLDPAIFVLIAIVIVLTICKCAMCKYEYDQKLLGTVSEDTEEQTAFQLSELEIREQETYE